MNQDLSPIIKYGEQKITNKPKVSSPFTFKYMTEDTRKIKTRKPNTKIPDNIDLTKQVPYLVSSSNFYDSIDSRNTSNMIKLNSTKTKP